MCAVETLKLLRRRAMGVTRGDGPGGYGTIRNYTCGDDKQVDVVMLGHTTHDLGKIVGADDYADIVELVAGDVFIGTFQSGGAKSLMDMLYARATNNCVHMFMYQQLEGDAVVAQLDY